MKTRIFAQLAILLFCSVFASCFAQAEEVETLTLYSGRNKSMVDPIIKKFEKDSGIKVQVKYGKTAQLAMLLKEEGDKTPADIFWGQDAGAMGALATEGLLIKLPAELLVDVPQQYRTHEDFWVPVSGRARVLAYAPDRVKEEDLPTSVFALTDPKWKGRVGWAPTNASFQAFVTAMRVMYGEEKTEKWLSDMMANGAKVYPKNTPIIQALAAGEIDLGLPNHYYLLRFLSKDPDFPVKQTLFAPKDIGNLVNVAGVGVLKSSKKQVAAQKLIAYLLAEDAQKFFVRETFEYPVLQSVEPAKELTGSKTLIESAPEVNLNKLNDLEGTVKLLRKVGLL